jgi:protein TonB
MSLDAWVDIRETDSESTLPDPPSPIFAAPSITRPPVPPLPPAFRNRSGNRRYPNLPRHLVGLTCALALHSGSMMLLFWQWSAWPMQSPPPPPIIIDLPPLPPTPSAPPQPVAQPHVASAKRPEPVPRLEPPEPIVIPVQTIPTVAVPLDLPAPSEIHLDDETSAASPAPSPTREGEVTFEGLLLARIEQFRRYPPDAARQGKQGVVHLRFRMDRRGRVLTAEVAESSGVPALDAEAIRTLRRAEPLPEIPADRPAMLDVSVPV